MQTSICSICGKSAFDAVAAPPPVAKRRRSELFAHDDVRQVAKGSLVILTVVAAVAFVLTRSDPAPTANALPPPASTTTVPPRPTTPDAAPSVAGGTRPVTAFVPGAPREVGEGLAPWETPPPVDIVAGGLLDPSLDFTGDIARVAALLDSLPDSFTVSPLDPVGLGVLGSTVDAELVETTQPFAARAVARADGTEVGELWLVASGGSPAGDAYLAAARDRWNVASALDDYAPAVGLRVWKLAADDSTSLWRGDLDADAVVILQTPAGASPATITDLLEPWRRQAS